jgi:hypothetical protein
MILTEARWVLLEVVVGNGPKFMVFGCESFAFRNE